MSRATTCWMTASPSTRTAASRPVVGGYRGLVPRLDIAVGGEDRAAGLGRVPPPTRTPATFTGAGRISIISTTSTSTMPPRTNGQRRRRLVRRRSVSVIRSLPRSALPDRVASARSISWAMLPAGTQFAAPRQGTVDRADSREDGGRINPQLPSRALPGRLLADPEVPPLAQAHQDR